MPTTKELTAAQIVTAFNTFRTRMGEVFGPYNSSGNHEKIQARVRETWGTDAAKSSDAYEIAFRELLAAGSLTADPSYVPPSFHKQIETMTGGEIGHRYRRDDEFRRLYDLAARSRW